MTVLSIDFETRATVDLRESGVYPYAAHRHTDIWCMAWAFDEEEPEIWEPLQCDRDQCAYPDHRSYIPSDIYDHIAAGGEIRAWNAAFERIIWREIMVKRYGAPAIKDEQFVCSAAEAAAMALPRSLDECASVLKVDSQKDKEGYALMLRMSRPRRWERGGTHGPADAADVPIWWDDAGKFQRLCEYCKQDVRTERSIVKALRRLVPREREVYLLDQRINDRGVHLDRQLVVAAKGIVEEGVERANL
ncbi:MAG TPA: hypothetical protein VFA81_12150, partial [Burkholderiales bacterium]|nr:hypothetical protein [Burkholderiales bacterium]